MSAIHIHEDDWGMRNLHPIDALPEIRTDIEAAVEAGARNAAPNGVGWTDIYMIREPTTDYAARGLKLVHAAAALAPLLPRVQSFSATAMAGFSGHDVMGSYERDAWAFGFDASCFVKLDPKDDLVERIWFECRTDIAAHRDALRGALLAIDALVASAIADYWLDVAGAIADPAFLEPYFRALADEEEDQRSRASPSD